jgi:hypothetical protein
MSSMTSPGAIDACCKPSWLPARRLTISSTATLSSILYLSILVDMNPLIKSVQHDGFFDPVYKFKEGVAEVRWASASACRSDRRLLGFLQ